jgi:hypothetical protein
LGRRLLGDARPLFFFIAPQYWKSRNLELCVVLLPFETAFDFRFAGFVLSIRLICAHVLPRTSYPRSSILAIASRLSSSNVFLQGRSAMTLISKAPQERLSIRITSPTAVKTKLLALN